MKVYGYVTGKQPIEPGDPVEILEFEAATVHHDEPLIFSHRFTLVAPMPAPAEA